MQKILILLVVLLILGGCKKNFMPEKSTCKKIYQDFMELYFEDNNYFSTYSIEDLRKFKDIANYCRTEVSLSKKDYAQYNKLLIEIKHLNKTADQIIEKGTQIHSQRLQSYN